jgi:hypothetical protein
VTPVSITLPLAAPVTRFTVMVALPEALEVGAGNNWAGDKLTTNYFRLWC